MRAKWQAVAASAAIVAVSSVSCRQVAGIGDPDPPPSCAAPAGATSSCADCLVERCCAELDACNADASCRRALECTSSCTDDTCRSACEKKEGQPDAAASIVACRAAKCASSCGLVCGGAGVPFVGCQPCASSCCEDGAAFAGSADGQRLRACRARCGAEGASCVEGCVNAHAEGADLERAAVACVGRACGFGGDWACVGHVEPRRATARSFTLTLFVIEWPRARPVADVVVKGCSVEDPTCDTPRFGMTKTVGSGMAKLEIVLNPAVALDAYQGYVELTRADYAPVILYFTPPLVMDTTLNVLFVSTETMKHIVEPAAGAPLAEDRGLVYFNGLDCGGRPTRGVSLQIDTADALSKAFYVRNASTGGATVDFALTATTEAGNGGMFNVPAGPATLTTRVDGLCLDTAKAAISIRPGTITGLTVPPLP